MAIASMRRSSPKEPHDFYISNHEFVVGDILLHKAIRFLKIISKSTIENPWVWAELWKNT